MATEQRTGVVWYETTGERNRVHELGYRPQAVRFSQPDDRLVRWADLPCRIPCGSGSLVVQNLYALGVVIDEDGTSGDPVAFIPTVRIQTREHDGRSRSIPWGVHLRAYEGYAREFPGSAARQSAERLAERGGFGEGELDSYVPGWRTEMRVDT